MIGALPRLSLSSVLVPWCLSEPSHAALAVQESKKVSFFADVRPILQQHCHGCHQPAKTSGEVVLTSFASLMSAAGSSAEPLVVPGRPDDSLIHQVIVANEDKPPQMPKDRPPLDAASVQKLRDWIAQGAADDTPKSSMVQYNKENPPAYAQPPVISSLDHSPDGSLLAVSGYHEVLLYSRDGALVDRWIGLSERIQSLAFSPDGSMLAAAGGQPARMGELQIWRVEDGELLLSLPVTFDSLYGASWSPDGDLVAFGCSDNTVRAVEAASGEQVLYQGAHEDWVLDTVFSADGSHLVTVSRDRSMKLISVATQQFIDNISSITPGALKGGLICVDRHPEKDELLIGGADGTPKIYQMHRTKERRIGDDFNLIRAFEAMPGRVFAVEWSRDGTKVAAVSSTGESGELCVFEAADGKRLASWHSAAPLYALSFRPDSSGLSIGGADGVVRCFDLAAQAFVQEWIVMPSSSAGPAVVETAVSGGGS